MVYLFAYQIPYLTPAAVIVALCGWGILTIQDATHALELLRPLIRVEQYHVALADLTALGLTKRMQAERYARWRLPWAL